IITGRGGLRVPAAVFIPTGSPRRLLTDPAPIGTEAVQVQASGFARPLLVPFLDRREDGTVVVLHPRNVARSGVFDHGLVLVLVLVEDLRLGQDTQGTEKDADGRVVCGLRDRLVEGQTTERVMGDVSALVRRFGV